VAKPISSLQVLAVLVLIALALSGWLWGFHYKQIADGKKLTEEEKALIDMQDQNLRLIEENERLSAEIRRLTESGSD